MIDHTERILLVEDDPAFRRTLSEVLDSHGYAITTAEDAGAALERLQEEWTDVVITDLVMPGIKGHELLARIRSTFPEIPVIAITGFGSVEGAVELTRAGAADYLTKPFRTAALLEALRRVLDETRPRREHARTRGHAGPAFDAIIGASRPMLDLFDRIRRVARSPAPVLVTGESGVGKELVARAIHQASGRGPFVPVNCGALPEPLMESELYGHVRGAFTGAEREKRGLFEAADGGTLFLDEIAELPLSLQPKLLRSIESGEVRRVGALEPCSVSVRIIAATHRDLEACVREGGFRDDLFWRINVLHLEVPPLRDRPEDIPPLIDAFLSALVARDSPHLVEIAPDARAALAAYPWPGNVRQLFNVLERAAAFTDGGRLALQDLPPELQKTAGARAVVRPGTPRDATLADVERDYILEILQRTGGNKTRAARILGIPRRTLYRRLAEYDRTVKEGP